MLPSHLTSGASAEEPATESSTIVIRRAEATEADARLLADLGATLFADAFGAMNAPDDLQLFLAKTYSPELQRAELRDRDRAAWIAEAQGQACGYALLRRGARSAAVTADSPAELQRIYTGRAWHGRGVGEALVRACIGQARAWNCDAVWLGVWEQNPRAIAFYEKWGFRRVGAQHFVVGTDSQRDYVMALELSNAEPERRHR